VTLWDHLDRIRTLDEQPYRSAIAAGVKLVMLDWAVYPHIGSRRPAGLSSTVMEGELRNRLGFTGVTETDAIEAGAPRAFGSIGGRSVQAAVAGDDLILAASQQVSEGLAAVRALVAAHRDGRLSQADFRASAARIIALRSSLPGDGQARRNPAPRLRWREPAGHPAIRPGSSSPAARSTTMRH